jgi:putative glutamine amidotransferase
MLAPLIGITTYRHSHQQAYNLISISEPYVQAISQAGGIPVLIPLGLSSNQVEAILPRLDGVLFSGGGDIDPGLYGCETHPEIVSVDSDRDRIEIQLLREVVHKGIPFLGICRGIQVINVALEGTLYTHIPDQLPGAVHHPYIEGNARDFLAHEVEIQPGSRLMRILGQDKMLVNSMHHQGINQLAQGLIATSHAPDGLIEGVELQDYNFGVAVQWHPEWLTFMSPMHALFRSFVFAADR